MPVRGGGQYRILAGRLRRNKLSNRLPDIDRTTCRHLVDRVQDVIDSFRLGVEAVRDLSCQCDNETINCLKTGDQRAERIRQLVWPVLIFRVSIDGLPSTMNS